MKHVEVPTSQHSDPDAGAGQLFWQSVSMLHLVVQLPVPPVPPVPPLLDATLPPAPELLALPPPTPPTEFSAVSEAHATKMPAPREVTATKRSLRYFTVSRILYASVLHVTTVSLALASKLW